MKSIKEKDKPTSAERMLLVVLGLFVILLAGALTMIMNSFDQISFVIICIGLAIICRSFRKYKGNIKVVRLHPTLRCPECSNTRCIEQYRLKVDSNTVRHHRIIYTRIETTNYWQDRLHCMSCEMDCSAISLLQGTSNISSN